MKYFVVVLLLLCQQMNALSQKANSDAVAYYCPPCNGHCDDIAFDKPGTCTHCGMLLAKQTKTERQKAMNEKKMTICFYLQDGVEVLDFAGPMEVFSYAGFKVFTVSKTKAPIMAQGILKVLPDYDIADAPPADIVAFFGGNSGAPSNDAQVIAWLKGVSVKYYFSVCTGAFVLGKAGFLDHQTVTTFHLSIDQLKRDFPEAKVLSNVRFVDNGTVITTAGISAGIDGALHLVAKLKGDEVAKNTAAYMEYDKWTPNQGLIVK